VSIELRVTMPCERCIGEISCVTVRREFEATVTRLHWIAEMHHIRLPDIDVVLDCKSFSPPTHKGEK
jgi:hypothetical protein